MSGYSCRVPVCQTVRAERAADLAPWMLPSGPVELGANWNSLMLARCSGETVPSQLSAPTRPRGIYVCGHSAGAHLAAMLLLANWTKHGVTPNLRGFRGWGRAGQPSPHPVGPEGLL